MSQSNSYLTSTYLALWWFPLLVVTVILLGSVLVLIPQATQLYDLNQAVRKADEQLVKAQTKVDQLSQLDAGQLEQLAYLIDTALPPHKPYFEILMTLQRLAGDTGVALGDFDLDGGSLSTKSAQTAATGKGSMKLSTEFTIQGKSDQITQFVTALQQALPLITVTSITIGTADDSELRQAELGVDIYYVMKSPGQTSVSLDPLPQLTEANQETLNVLAQYNRMVQPATDSAVINFDRTDVFSF